MTPRTSRPKLGLLASLIGAVGALFLTQSEVLANEVTTIEIERPRQTEPFDVDLESRLQAPKDERFVVQKLRAPKGLRGMAQDLTEELLVHLGELSRQHPMVFLSEAELAVMLDHAQILTDVSSDKDCVHVEECVRRISEAQEANHVLFGRIDRLGDSFVAVLSLLDVHQNTVDRAETCTGQTREELSKALQAAADRVLGLESPSNHKVAVRPVISSRATIGVVPIGGLEETPSVGAMLTQMLGVEIRRYEYSVQTRDELITMLHYAADRQEIRDNNALEEALIEIAGSMGVDYLATGTTGSFDDTIVIVLKLIDIHEAKVVSRVAESYRGPMAHLPVAMRFATAKLFGQQITGKGDMEILTNVEGSFRIDHGARQPLAPETTPVEGLEADKHHLKILAEGYYPYSADIYIDPDQALRLHPELVELPTPWYKSGLFWTLTGAVVAGTTTAILLATLPPKGSQGALVH